MKSTFLKIALPRVTSQFHRCIVEHLWQQECLPFSHKIINQLMCIDFIRQGIKSQNSMSLSQKRLQTQNNRKRQFIQLLLGELPLEFAHLLSQF